MGRLLRRFIARTFERHCDEHHLADYEVCRHPRCRLANVVEVVLYRHLYDGIPLSVRWPRIFGLVPGTRKETEMRPFTRFDRILVAVALAAGAGVLLLTLLSLAVAR